MITYKPTATLLRFCSFYEGLSPASPNKGPGPISD